MRKINWKEEMKQFKVIDIILIIIIIILYLQAREYKIAYQKCLADNDKFNFGNKVPNVTINITKFEVNNNSIYQLFEK